VRWRGSHDYEPKILPAKLVTGAWIEFSSSRLDKSEQSRDSVCDGPEIKKRRRRGPGGAKNVLGFWREKATT
jgi:hypothetical protein